MKNYLIISNIIIAFLIVSCSTGQTQPMKPALSATEFSKKNNTITKGKYY